MRVGSDRLLEPPLPSSSFLSKLLTNGYGPWGSWCVASNLDIPPPLLAGSAMKTEWQRINNKEKRSEAKKKEKRTNEPRRRKEKM